MPKKGFFSKHQPRLGALEILKYIGPGFLVTVGFIDPGNWAANMAAGSRFGYGLLWVVTLSTFMLIVLQHNAAHLGIATGMCLSEAAVKFFPRWLSRSLLSTAMLAAVFTSLAEILGGAIGLNMLCGLPLPIGAVLMAVFSSFMLFSNSYRSLEKWILAFVSLIGLAFIFELTLVRIGWGQAAASWLVPSFPTGSLVIVMSVLGAVVMPHNLFLHSEVIQSRQWHIREEAAVRRQLKLEFLDTLLAMGVGWAINSAMIILAASTFHSRGLTVTELPQAQAILKPLLGSTSALVFGLALLLAGFASSITAAMAGGSIFAGIAGEPFDIADPHSRTGALITLISPLLIIFFIHDPFQGLLLSQMALSIQLPFTVIALVTLTSSPRVMGTYANAASERVMIWIVSAVIIGLNILLLMQVL